MPGSLCRPPLLSALLTRFLLAFALLAWHVSSIARVEMSDTELKLLPRYCPDTMGFTIYGDATDRTSPRAGYWVSLMGPSFWAMHHYCVALLYMNRARKAGMPPQQRTFLWEEAAANIEYVIRNATADFIMLPEVYTRLGETALQLAHADKASVAFARARELKPDYWPAYSHWAEFLMRNGQRQEAMKIITSGLQHSPNAKVLLDQYRALGGKPSDLPKPVDAAQPGPANADAERGVDVAPPVPYGVPDDK